MLQEYPERIVAKVCDPAKGLPSKVNFLTLAELKDALEGTIRLERMIAEMEQPRQKLDVIFVADGSPQMKAWETYRGRSCPRSKQMNGWWFPTEWPPKQEGEAF